VRRFVGRWILAVAAVHTVFALVVFPEPLLGIVRAGFVDTIGHDPMRAAVAWFVLFGGALAVAGIAVDELEKREAPLRRAGVMLAAMVALGLVWMPASGFWLALPAIAVMLRRGPRETSAV
jgi:hypothetical protein